MRDEPERFGAGEHVDGLRRHAAELAAERPFGAGAVGQDAAEDARARRGAGDLLHFLHAVDGEERDAQRMRARNVALLLDRVAVGDALRRGAGFEHHLDLRHRSGVEGGAEPGEQAQDLGRRIGLHRIEDAAVGKGAGEGVKIAAHHVEIDHEARAHGSSLVEERADAVRHHREVSPCQALQPGESCADASPAMETGWHPWIPPTGQRPGGSRRTASETDESSPERHRLEREDPIRTSGNESVCLFSVAGLWRADRDQKSPPPSLL